MIRLPYISCALFLAISACGTRSHIDAQASRTGAIPGVSEGAPTVIGLPHGPTSPTTAAPVPVAKIPAALQGRWGLEPRDCSGSPGRSRSLLVITPNGLSFNESHAVLTNDVESDPHSISGTFEFNGAGRSWSKFETLRLDNPHLIRTESDPAASFSYARCS